MCEQKQKDGKVLKSSFKTKSKNLSNLESFEKCLLLHFLWHFDNSKLNIRYANL